MSLAPDGVEIDCLSEKQHGIYNQYLNPQKNRKLVALKILKSLMKRIK